MKVKIIESKRNSWIFHMEGERHVFSTSDILKDKVYDVIEISKSGTMYRIIDESGEDYLYCKDLFEIVEE